MFSLIKGYFINVGMFDSEASYVFHLLVLTLLYDKSDN